jgi:hypothetical protein
LLAEFSITGYTHSPATDKEIIMFADNQESAQKKSFRQHLSLFLFNLLGLRTLDAYDAAIGGVRPIEEHELTYHFLQEYND